MGCITLPLCLDKLQVTHDFVVVHSLIVPSDFGCLFSTKYSLVLDFTSNPVCVTSKAADDSETLPKSMKSIVYIAKKAVQAFDEPAGETTIWYLFLMFPPVLIDCC